MDALLPHEGASCYGSRTATMRTVLAKTARRAAPVSLVGWACAVRATPPLCIELLEQGSRALMPTTILDAEANTSRQESKTLTKTRNLLLSFLIADALRRAEKMTGERKRSGISVRCG